MDPLPLSPGHWERVDRLLVDLTVFVGLALTAAFAFMLGRVVIPAFADERADDGDADRVRIVRLLLYPVAAASAVGMLVALGRGLVVAVDLLREVYPRLLI